MNTIKVRAMQTLKNAYDQVLFVDGKEYEAELSGKTYFVLNELHTETPMRERRLKESFELA